MARVEKTVFISYRRSGGQWCALAVSQDLTHHGYDVFFDFEDMQSGDFRQVIVEHIRSRAHFLVLLTPSSLERVDEPDDVVRMEIETALDSRRNVVPLMLDGFHFGTPSIATRLTGKLADLKKYSGLSVPSEYFPEAMAKLRTHRLNVSIDAVLHPVSPAALTAAADQGRAASGAPSVDSGDLAAARAFERGVDATERDVKIRCYTEALNLRPNYAAALFNRGVVRREMQDFGGAIEDYDGAIRLKPDDAEAFSNRAGAYRAIGDLPHALADLDAAVALRPTFATALSNRAVVRLAMGDSDGALNDAREATRLRPTLAEAFNTLGNVARQRNLVEAIAAYDHAIRLNPAYVEAFTNRGRARGQQGDTNGALEDYDAAIELRPGDPYAHFNRAGIRARRGDHSGAIADLQAYLDSGAGMRDGDQAAVERLIADHRSNL